jgi:hypothetical protein
MSFWQYFSNMVDGVKPRSQPLLLNRVIMNTIPRFGAPPQPGDEPDMDAEVELGCCPYLQLFKGECVRLIVCRRLLSARSHHRGEDSFAIWPAPKQEEPRHRG